MSESKSGYILNDGEVSNKSDAASCVNYRLSPEEREIIIIMDDKDRKWKASCSSPTYMRNSRNKVGHVREKNIIVTELYVRNTMKLPRHLQLPSVRLNVPDARESR